jgi:hypothetical protein
LFPPSNFPYLKPQTKNTINSPLLRKPPEELEHVCGVVATKDQLEKEDRKKKIKSIGI